MGDFKGLKKKKIQNIKYYTNFNQFLPNGEFKGLKKIQNIKY